MITSRGCGKSKMNQRRKRKEEEGRKRKKESLEGLIIISSSITSIPIDVVVLYVVRESPCEDFVRKFLDS